MLCSSAWGEQLTLLWEFCGIPEKWWTTNLRSYMVLWNLQFSTQVPIQKWVVKHCCKSVPGAFQLKEAQSPKAPGTNSSVHSCCSEIALPAHCSCHWDEPHHQIWEIWKVSQIPNKLPKTAPLRVWSTEQSWPNHRNRNIYFHASDKAAPECSGRESAGRSLHLLGHDLHHPHSPCVSCQTSIPTAVPSPCMCSDHLIRGGTALHLQITH